MALRARGWRVAYSDPNVDLQQAKRAGAAEDPAESPDATNNLSAAKPPAYYRMGDLQTDVKAIEPLLRQLHVSADLSKAQ